MAEKSLILKSASFEPGGDDAREGNLESVMENAGYDVVESFTEPGVPAAEGDSATLAGKEPPPRKVSRRERAIERATAPLREKIKQLESGRPPQAAQTEAVAAQPKPQRAEFANDEAYEDALVKWGNAKFAADKAIEDAQAAQRQHLERNLQNYGAQTKEAKTRYKDWDEVVDQDIFIGRDAQLAILELENGAEVIYWLGKHPVAAEKLGKLNPVSAIMEVGRLSASLGAAFGEGYESRRPRPRVPAPVRTVSTAGTSGGQTFAEIAARPNYPGKAKDLKRAMAEQ
jgi:hypothetical protein